MVELLGKIVLSRSRGLTHKTITLFIAILEDNPERQSRGPKFATRTPSYESSFLTQLGNLVNIYTFL